MKLLGNLISNNQKFIPKVFGGVDTTNLLYEVNQGGSTYSSHTYNATEDCFVICELGGVNASATLDGVSIVGIENPSWFSIPMKKGQTISMYHTTLRVKIFGIKY